jgi:hypothetical protein
LSLAPCIFAAPCANTAQPADDTITMHCRHLSPVVESSWTGGNIHTNCSMPKLSCSPQPPWLSINIPKPKWNHSSSKVETDTHMHALRVHSHTNTDTKTQPMPQHTQPLLSLYVSTSPLRAAQSALYLSASNQNDTRTPHMSPHTAQMPTEGAASTLNATNCSSFRTQGTDNPAVLLSACHTV